MWFILLLVLALAAYLIVKAVKAQSVRKSTDHTPAALGREDTSALEASPTASTAAPVSTVPVSAAPVSTPAASTAAAAGAMPVEPATSVAASDASTATAAGDGIDTVDPLHDIREMIKMLNLAESDAPRLGISKEEFSSLRSSAGASDDRPLPSDKVQSDVAARLRRMLA